MRLGVMPSLSRTGLEARSEHDTNGRILYATSHDALFFRTLNERADWIGSFLRETSYVEYMPWL